MLKNWSYQKFFTILFMASLCIWFAGFIVYLNCLPTKQNDLALKTDAIVVLTGGAKRIDEGFLLLQNKMAEKLFISGVYKYTRVKHLQSNYDKKLLKCCVILGYEAMTTKENVIEVGHWLESHNYQSIRLVTSDYHMLRSLKEFKHSYPHLTIIPHPVFSDNIWYQSLQENPSYLFILMKEYSKLLYVYLQLR